MVTQSLLVTHERKGGLRWALLDVSGTDWHSWMYGRVKVDINKRGLQYLCICNLLGGDNCFLIVLLCCYHVTCGHANSAALRSKKNKEIPHFMEKAW